MSSKQNAISLFSGMGGDTLGIHNAGLNVLAISIDTPYKSISGPAIKNCVKTSGGVKSAESINIKIIAYLKKSFNILSS